MIEVNLLPGAPRKKGGGSAGPSVDYAAVFARFSGQLKNVYLIAGAGLAVVALLSVGGMFLKQRSDRGNANERLAKAVTDSTRYSSILEARAKLEAKRDTLRRQVNLIRSIDEDRYVWPHILDEVSRALPAYTWITFLQFSGAGVGQINVVANPKPLPPDPKNPRPRPMDTAIPKEPVTFRLTGRTVDIQAMTRFMRDLQASPFIELVEIERSDPGSDQGKEATQFTLSLRYRRQDSTSTAVRWLPLVISGGR
jgi:Tfp pilus assembly protein PilN